jgi:FixJ family two-component response regulator
VVDDDEAVRDSLGMLLESVGLEVELFGSATEFLDRFHTASPGCLVLDVRLPGMSGLELQKELAARGAELPIVFITGHGDVPMAVGAMQEGAVDFLEKPFKEQELLDRVSRALLESSRRRHLSGETSAIARRLETLTPRERQVLELVVEGAPNKVIASRLGASQRTIEIHRANVMKKMQADSLAQLVRMVMRLEQTSQAT